MLKDVRSDVLMTEQTFSSCTIATLCIYLHEILCNAPDNLQFQHLLVKPRSISPDRLHHPLEAQILKTHIFVKKR